MDRECKNAGSSWCVDFDCKDCPVRKPSSRTQKNVTQHKVELSKPTSADDAELVSLDPLKIKRIPKAPTSHPFRKCIRDNQDCDREDWDCEICQRRQVDVQGFESTRLPDKNITFHEIGSVYYWLARMQFANYQVALKSLKENFND